MQTDAPGPVTVESAAIRTEHRALARGLGWSALALLVLPMVLLVGLKALGLREVVPWLPGLLGTAMFVAPLAGVLSLVAAVVSPKRAGTIAVDGATLHVRRDGRRRSVPLARITDGWLEPRDSEVALRLGSGDVIRARVAGDDEGRKLLEATGLDPARHTLRTRLGDTVFLDWMVGLLGPGLVGSIVAAATTSLPRGPFHGPVVVALFLALMALLAVAVRAALGPADVVIGVDGITISHRWQRRFVPYAAIASIRHSVGALELVLKKGGVVRAKARNLSAADMERLETRIGDARRAARGEHAAEGALAQLDRGGRDAAAWREALAGLLARAKGYREVGVSRDELVLALESPSTAAERRLGAAIALAGAPAERTRIAAAAAACANPRVRIALEAVARGDLDDEAIEEALADDQASAGPGATA